VKHSPLIWQVGVVPFHTTVGPLAIQKLVLSPISEYPLLHKYVAFSPNSVPFGVSTIPLVGKSVIAPQSENTKI